MNIEESLIELKNYINDKTNPYFDNYGFATVRAKQIQAIETLLTAYEKEKEKNKEAKNLLIDMVNQFAYEDNKHERLYTGGLSTLEDAFYFLDIDEGIKREDLWNLKEE